MKGKRLGAKLIDMVIFIFVTAFATGSLFIIADVFLSSDFLINMSEMMTEISTLTPEAALAYIDENQKLFFMTTMITFAGVFSGGFIYFGVLGYFAKGSLGKYVFKIGIVDKNSSRTSNMFKLFVREPFLQLQFISLLFYLAHFIIPNIMIFNVFGILYVVCFIIDRDFRNQILKIDVVGL